MGLSHHPSNFSGPNNSDSILSALAAVGLGPTFLTGPTKVRQDGSRGSMLLQKKRQTDRGNGRILCSQILRDTDLALVDGVSLALPNCLLCIRFHLSESPAENMTCLASRRTRRFPVSEPDVSSNFRPELVASSETLGGGGGTPLTRAGEPCLPLKSENSPVKTKFL